MMTSELSNLSFFLFFSLPPLFDSPQHLHLTFPSLYPHLQQFLLGFLSCCNGGCGYGDDVVIIVMVRFSLFVLLAFSGVDGCGVDSKDGMVVLVMSAVMVIVVVMMRTFTLITVSFWWW